MSRWARVAIYVVAAAFCLAMWLLDTWLRAVASKWFGW